jgi:hypothetical protein
MVSAMIIAFGAILMFIGKSSSYYIWKVLAGFVWIGLGVWWIYSPPMAAGSPPDEILLVVAFGAGIAAFFWSFWTSKYSPNGQEAGGRFRIPFMQSDEDEAEERQRSAPTRRERVAVYKERMNARLGGQR